MVFKISFLILCFTVSFLQIQWTTADFISFGVGQSVCRQHEEFLNSGGGNVVPAVKTPPADVEAQCLWYQMDKNCIKGSETDCVAAKTCQELGISGSGAKAGRSTKTSKTASTKGSAVYRVKANDKNGVKALQSLETSYLVDFYSPPKLDGFTVVQVLNRDAEEVIELFKANGMEFEVTIPDVKTYFEEERRSRMERRQSRAKIPGQITWDEFYNLTEIYDWLEKLRTDYPDLVTLETIGETFEGREIKVVKICKGGCHRPTFFIESGIHAREWAASTAGTYMVNELVTSSKEYSEILDKLDVYILPILNPDGFDFTWSTTRNWRKNRSPLPGNDECDPEVPDDFGQGVDLNRNFGFKWGEGDNGSCSLIYPGETGFSEKESSAYRDFIFKEQKAGVNFVGYTAIHAYGPAWMLPWAWTEENPENYEQLKRIGDASAAALESVHGTHYVVKTVSSYIEQTVKGSSLDFLFGGVDEGGAGIKFCFALEVRGNDNITFVLPPEQIIPNAEEIWAGIQVTLKLVAEEIHA